MTFWDGLSCTDLFFFTLFNENRLGNLQNSTNHEPGKILSMEAAKRVSEAHQLSREIKKIIISKSIAAIKTLYLIKLDIIWRLT